MPDFYGVSQPPPGTPVNRAHPLLVGCSLLVPFNDRAGRPHMDIGNPAGELAPVGAPAWVGGKYGSAYKLTGVNDEMSFGVSTDFIPTTHCTVAIAFKKSDGSNRASRAFGTDNNSAANLCAAHVPYSDGTVYWDFGGNSGGSTRVSVGGLTVSGYNFWVFTTGARGMEIWQNGLLKASNSANPTRTALSTLKWKVGALGGADQADLVEYGFFGVWRRQLSPVEIQSLSAAPFQMYRAPIYRTFAGSTIGGGPAGGAGGGLLLRGVG